MQDFSSQFQEWGQCPSNDPGIIELSDKTSVTKQDLKPTLSGMFFLLHKQWQMKKILTGVEKPDTELVLCGLRKMSPNDWLCANVIDWHIVCLHFHLWVRTKCHVFLFLITAVLEFVFSFITNFQVTFA